MFESAAGEVVLELSDHEPGKTGAVGISLARFGRCGGVELNDVWAVGLNGTIVHYLNEKRQWSCSRMPGASSSLVPVAGAQSILV
jgi:hypothetical protein